MGGAPSQSERCEEGGIFERPPEKSNPDSQVVQLIYLYLIYLAHIFLDRSLIHMARQGNLTVTLL
jgi:hypothetical protein